MDIQELYTPKAIAANGVQAIAGNGIGGFLCTTSGTITVTDNGTTVVAAMAVTASTYYPMPFSLINGLVTLTGGAAGTIGMAQ